ncbi:DEAD/DEAH box helicase family protein [Ruminococcus sp.]|uniref:DEAD/DEAH box helicase family protein n=1 Tax=Ruminococcus sp. TaxID=41978 RepID=UPI0025D87A14|nr:DEAD/DEAH box helicase family protein [Ruminococcus sp.]
MKDKEAKARIIINQLLIDAGWRFFDSEEGKANIQLEPNVKITQQALDSLGEDYQKVKNGFVDYLLLDDNSTPLLVLEAKRSQKHPLDGKEQAREYALSLRAKYIILSNGEIHFFWNLSKGNPEIITVFPTYESLVNNKALNASPQVLIDAIVDKYYIAKSQEPGLENTSAYKSGNDDVLFDYCMSRNLKVMRYYQLNAVKSIQAAVKEGKTRFLFEMATGTGKTLTAAAIIKLFICSEVANRVLFFVDRLELENQALKDFRRYLAKDGIISVIYKNHKDDWNSADVVITTIQSFSTNNKYQRLFSPSDFDLIISDEAHRSLGASNRAVFEYFMGYKLGLTATPKNYLKGIDFDIDDPREIEKRILLDTYHIFGCDSGTATFSYTLLDGVNDEYLINPTVVDARSEITTKLLSNEGFVLNIDNDEADFKVSGKATKAFDLRSYEKSFFSDSTNNLFCYTFMKNALRDPISNEIGKTIIFCVNIAHARKITEILNAYAEKMFPGKYNSDFAVQITSNIENAQQMTINFANNNLNGKTGWLVDYDSSKTRVAVTVGMMTTGYDCSDILNLCFFRPVFSPADFIQMKGRGTRTYTFKYEKTAIKKETFKLFDFFAVCDYFEDDFNYDEKIALPKEKSSSSTGESDFIDTTDISTYISETVDTLKTYDEELVGAEGMKIDRKFYQSFENKVASDSVAQDIISQGDEEQLEHYLRTNIFDKPTEFFTISKLERALGLDRRLTMRELVQYLMGYIDRFKCKQELIDDEFSNFQLLNQTDIADCSSNISSIHTLFNAFLTDSSIRKAIRDRQLQVLINSPLAADVRATKDVRIKGKRLLDYMVDYVAVNDINCERYSN